MSVNMIDSLLVDEDVKRTLKKIEKMTHLEDASKSNMVPSVFLVAERGCGVSSLGKVYREIIDNSAFMGIRGSETYIELVFPKDNPLDENLFFSSPQRAASVRNRFYGTMLISFEEFDGQDLLRSESFKRLLHFVESNKENIYFVFHVLPEYSPKSQLVARLREFLNIVEITINRPDFKMAFSYVVSELLKKELIFTDESRSLFEEGVLDVIVNSNIFAGYKTLDKLVCEIEYEMAYSETTGKVITKAIIEAMAEKYSNDIKATVAGTKIGFGK